MVELNVNVVLGISAAIITAVLILELVLLKDKNKNIFQSSFDMIKKDKFMQFYIVLVILAFVIPMFTDNAFIIYTLTAITSIIALQYVFGIILIIAAAENPGNIPK